MLLNALIIHLTEKNLIVAHSAPTAEVEIAHVTSDSRTVRAGSLFVAVSGGTTDGHRFIPVALERGAIVLIGTKSAQQISEQGIDLPAHIPYLQVSNSRRALAHSAALLHDFPSHTLTVIGVTGTDGKTTTSSLLEAILIAATRDAAFPTGRVGVITTVGARILGQESETGLHVTTPDAPEVQHFLAQMRGAGCQYAIIESTSHGLDQERVASVEYDVAAVTNITHEHLDYHGTRDAYVAAKAKLFRMLFQRQAKPTELATPFAVLNADDEGSYGALQQAIAEERAAHDSQVTVYTYGLQHISGPSSAAHQPVTANPISAANIRYAPDRTRFTLYWQDGEFELESRLIGEFNLYNVLAAASVALGVGITPEVIQTGVAEFPGVIGRMERIDAGQPFLAIVDFAHTPVSLERALHTLRPLVGQRPDGEPGQLIAIFGCAGLRDRAKRYLMGKASGRLADFTVVTAEDPRTEDINEINRQIVTGLEEQAAEYTVISDRTEAIQFAVNLAQPGDIVAAFGKGHERSMCFGEIEYPWSDQEAMKAALATRFLG